MMGFDNSTSKHTPTPAAAAASIAVLQAILEIICNPVNSTVPIASEVLKAAGCYDPRKLLGVTTLDVVRANTFVAQVRLEVCYAWRHLSTIVCFARRCSCGMSCHVCGAQGRIAGCEVVIYMQALV